MKITKLYECTLELVDPLDIYGDIDSICLHKLKEKYEGVCYKNTLIIKILKIIQRSHSRISKNSLEGSCIIDVKFEAKSVIYTNQEIITKCAITNVSKTGGLLLQSKYCSIYVKPHPLLIVLKKGQYINVQVGKARYILNKTSIAINALPYFLTAEQNAPVYKIVSNIEPIVEEKLESLKKEQELFAQLNKDDVKYFTNLIYPYKKTPKFPGWKKQNLFKWIQNNKNIKTPIYVTRPDIINKEEPDFYVSDNYQENFITENANIILVQYLNDVEMHLKMIRQMIKIYPKDKRKSYANLWNVYKQLKKS